MRDAACSSDEGLARNNGPVDYFKQKVLYMHAHQVGATITSHAHKGRSRPVWKHWQSCKARASMLHSAATLSATTACFSCESHKENTWHATEPGQAYHHKVKGHSCMPVLRNLTARATLATRASSKLAHLGLI